MPRSDGSKTSLEEVVDMRQGRGIPSCSPDPTGMAYVSEGDEVACESCAGEVYFKVPADWDGELKCSFCRGEAKCWLCKATAIKKDSEGEPICGRCLEAYDDGI